MATTFPQSTINPVRNKTVVSNRVNYEHSTISYPLYALRSPLSSLRYPLHAVRFMQNKANFRKTQMNVSSFITKDYENKSNWTLGENKPNQTQFMVSKVEPPVVSLPALSLSNGSNLFQTFCRGCHTEKIMFCRRLNGKCQLIIVTAFAGMTILLMNDY